MQPGMRNGHYKYCYVLKINIKNKYFSQFTVIFYEKILDPLLGR